MILRTILFTGAVQSIFQILLLRLKNRNHPADYWLMAWLFLICLQLAFYYQNSSSDHIFTGRFGLVAFSIPVLSAPLLFQYILSISCSATSWRLIKATYFLPWVIYLAMALGIWQYYAAGIFISSGYPHFQEFVPTTAACLITYPMAIVPGVYAILGFIVLQRYQKDLPDRFSYTETINLRWLKWLVISIFILFILLFMLIRFGPQVEMVSSANLFTTVGAVLSVAVFLIGYFNLRQNKLLLAVATAQPEANNTATVTKNQKTGLNTATVDLIYLRLLSHMEKEHSYLKDDLSLSILAKEMCLSTNQLSQVINQKSNANFFNFINAYRVEAVKRKLIDSSLSHLSILGIAYECGFRSKSAFNRIFKEHAGISPIEYQRQHKLGSF